LQIEGRKNMSQKDGFASGFLVGTIVGGVVGGVLGTLLASRRDAELADQEEIGISDGSKTAAKRRQMRSAANEGLEMETARRSLEDKIAQLNATIDDVRNQLGNVNGSSSRPVEGSVSQDS
jgi:gas vesicle protein